MKRNPRSSAVTTPRPIAARNSLYRALLAGLVLGLSGVFWAQAQAADVRGSLKAAGDPKPAPENVVRSPYFREWNGFLEPKKPSHDLSRNVAVVLIGADSTKDAATVVLKDGQLSPGTIVMQQGTSLRVRNEDDFTHQLFAEGLKSFDSIETSSGQGRQIQIDQPGTFAIRDALAPHVRGTLHVLPKLSAVATPQADGGFVFNGVAAGSYTLKVFVGDREAHSASIQVEGSQALVIDPIHIDLRTGK